MKNIVGFLVGTVFAGMVLGSIIAFFLQFSLMKAGKGEYILKISYTIGYLLAAIVVAILVFK